jgi:lipoate---protein ligase
MLFQAERKVPGGKLVRIKLEENEGRIASIRIEGDFFVHPEEGLAAMESSLVGMRIDDVEGIETALNGTIKERGLSLIGFSANDIIRLIRGR